MVRKFGVSDVIIYIILAVLALLCIISILHMIAISFSDNAAAAAGLVGFWPVRFNTAAYEILLDNSRFFDAYLITIYRVILGIAVSLPVQILVGYAVSKDKKAFKERGIVMWMMLITMLFSGGLIPTFMVLRAYGMLDTMSVLILPFALSPFTVLLFMNYFRSIPKSLEEAAAIDGAGTWKTLTLIYIPAAIPIIATITLFTFVFHFNDYFSGLIYIRTPALVPLQTFIFREGISPTDILAILDPELAAQRRLVGEMNFEAAKIIISIIPLVIVYPFLQRYFITGIMLGSVKE